MCFSTSASTQDLSFSSRCCLSSQATRCAATQFKFVVNVSVLFMLLVICLVRDVAVYATIV